jgi:hypothetical protein
MRRPKSGLIPSEEIALRRVAYGVVRPKDLNTADVERLVLLGLVVVRDRSLLATPRGEHLVADLPTDNLLTGPLKKDKHVLAVAKALGVKL